MGKYVRKRIMFEGADIEVVYVSDVGMSYKHPTKGRCGRRFDAMDPADAQRIRELAE
jgi:hypothetical protein